MRSRLPLARPLRRGIRIPSGPDRPRQPHDTEHRQQRAGPKPPPYPPRAGGPPGPRSARLGGRAHTTRFLRRGRSLIPASPPIVRRRPIYPAASSHDKRSRAQVNPGGPTGPRHSIRIAIGVPKLDGPAHRAQAVVRLARRVRQQCPGLVALFPSRERNAERHLQPSKMVASRVADLVRVHVDLKRVGLGPPRRQDVYVDRCAAPDRDQQQLDRGEVRAVTGPDVDRAAALVGRGVPAVLETPPPTRRWPPTWRRARSPRQAACGSTWPAGPGSSTPW